MYRFFAERLIPGGAINFDLVSHKDPTHIGRQSKCVKHLLHITIFPSCSVIIISSRGVLYIPNVVSHRQTEVNHDDTPNLSCLILADICDYFHQDQKHLLGHCS